MPTIEIQTEIRAPLERVFDLTRSIDVHTLSTSETKEKAIAGVTRGLIGLDEEVTFSAVHLGQKLTLTSKITQFSPYSHFRDTQVEGPFQSFDHDHFFTTEGESTLMRDVFTYTPPYGALGKTFSFLYLKGYLREFLKRRHQTIKEIAEGLNWRLYLPLDHGSS